MKDKHQEFKKSYQPAKVSIPPREGLLQFDHAEFQNKLTTHLESQDVNDAQNSESEILLLTASPHADELLKSISNQSLKQKVIKELRQEAGNQMKMISQDHDEFNTENVNKAVRNIDSFTKDLISKNEDYNRNLHKNLLEMPEVLNPGERFAVDLETLLNGHKNPFESEKIYEKGHPLFMEIKNARPTYKGKNSESVSFNEDMIEGIAPEEPGYYYISL